MNASPNPRRAVLARPRPAEEAAEARLALLRAEYARLVTAARATVAAACAGLDEPLVFLEAELARQGGLPSRESAVLTVLADTRTAMALAGRFTQPHEPATTAA